MDMIFKNLVGDGFTVPGEAKCLPYGSGQTEQAVLYESNRKLSGTAGADSCDFPNIGR